MASKRRQAPVCPKCGGDKVVAGRLIYICENCNFVDLRTSDVWFPKKNPNDRKS